VHGKCNYTNITFGGFFDKNGDKSECGKLNFKNMRELRKSLSFFRNKFYLEKSVKG